MTILRGSGRANPSFWGEIIISDAEKLVAIYLHRDAVITKITEETKKVLQLVCGVPEEKYSNAARVAVEYVTNWAALEHFILRFLSLTQFFGL